jgi:hypothetical protein
MSAGDEQTVDATAAARAHADVFARDWLAESSSGATSATASTTTTNRKR